MDPVGTIIPGRCRVDVHAREAMGKMSEYKRLVHVLPKSS